MLFPERFFSISGFWALLDGEFSDYARRKHRRRGGGYEKFNFSKKFALKKSFCVHNNLPTVLCPISMGYWLNLNAIADIGWRGGYAVNKHFCLHNNLPTVLCPIFMEYRSNVLNAIADILNSRIFENEIEKTAMRKPFVCSPEEIAKEITIVKTICLYIDRMLIFLGPHSNLLLLIWNL